MTDSVIATLNTLEKTAEELRSNPLTTQQVDRRNAIIKKANARARNERKATAMSDSKFTKKYTL